MAKSLGKPLKMGKQNGDSKYYTVRETGMSGIYIPCATLRNHIFILNFNIHFYN